MSNEAKAEVTRKGQRPRRAGVRRGIMCVRITPSAEALIRAAAQKRGMRASSFAGMQLETLAMLCLDPGEDQGGEK